MNPLKHATAAVGLSLITAIVQNPAVAATGDPLTPEITVATLTPLLYEDPPSISAVARDGAGNFAVAYSTGANHSQMYVQRFYKDGTRNGAPILVFNTAGDRAAIAMDDAGDFVVAALAGIDNVGVIYAQRYNANGMPLGAPIHVASLEDIPATFRFLSDLPELRGRSASPIFIPNVSVAMNRETGDFLVAWQDHIDFVYLGNVVRTALYSRDAIQSRPYRFDGTPEDGVQTLTVESSKDGDEQSLIGRPIASANPLGGYGVAWSSVVMHRSGPNAGKARVSPFNLRLFDSAGKPGLVNRKLAIEDVINDSYEPGLTGMAFTFGADGSPVLAWSTSTTPYDNLGNGSTFDESLYARRYSSSLAPQGGSTLITTRVQTQFSLPKFGVGSGMALAPTSAGAVITWADDSDALIHGQYLASGGTGKNPSVILQDAEFTIGGYDAFGDGSSVGWRSNLSSVTDANSNVLAVWDEIKARLFQAPQ